MRKFATPQSPGAASTCSSREPSGAETGGCMRSLSTRSDGGEAAVLGGRSEEHTSELQSRFDLVCRLLLEKKKKQITADNVTTTRKDLYTKKFFWADVCC